MPEVSVVIRSYNRLPSLCELIERVLAQRGVDLEIVVVDQTTRATDSDRARLDALAGDPRVRIACFPPLGGARARNEGARAARSPILLFMDDDDLPLGDDWVAKHLRNYADPKCIAVTGRDVDEPGEAVPYRDRERSHRRCMTYSPWLRMPWIYARNDRRKIGVQALHGGNASMRRTVLERFGLWDETTRIEDEASLCYRIRAGKEADEYLVFDPECVIVRGKDVPGGLEKRRLPVHRHFTDLLVFMHVVVGRYHPLRLVAFYPAYLYTAFRRSMTWMREQSRAYPTVASRRWAAVRLALGAPWWWLVALRRSVAMMGRATPRLESTRDDHPGAFVAAER